MRPFAESRALAVMVPALVAALRSQIAVEDAVFDRLYPEHVRRMSHVHWTPVAVALRAAALLAPEPTMRVLDVGAGPGKLCCIGALARGGTWCGIERNPALVAAATEAARSLEVEHCTRFETGDLTQFEWAGFDSLYLYNPFESLLFGRGPEPGDCDPREAGPVLDQVAQTQKRLSDLASGTRVVTFHGFGGAMPASLALVVVESIAGGELALWIKR